MRHLWLPATLASASSFFGLLPFDPDPSRGRVLHHPHYLVLQMLAIDQASDMGRN